MTDHEWYKFTAISLGFIASLWGQSKTVTPTFDVASIRQVPPNAPSIVRDADFSPVLPGGRFVDPCIHVSVLIGFAYGTKHADDVIGLPGWAENGPCYAIAAKAGEEFSATTPADNVAQVRLMMRALLADRFHLQIHPETQNKKGLQLKVAKTGLKISEVAAPIPPATEGHVFGYGGENGSGRLVGHKATMAGMAQCLTVSLGQLVVDQTGLRGYYDFDLRWAGDGEKSPSAFGTPDFVVGAISALRRDVGLEVTSATIPVTLWRATHLEQPTEN